MQKNSINILPLLFMCLGSILIGSSAVFIRLSDLGPLMTGFYRMLFALPLLALWLGWERKEKAVPIFISSKNYKELTIIGVLFAFDLAIWNWSIDYTTIVNSTLLNNTAAFFVPLIMWIFFKKKPAVKVLAASFIGFIGCALLVGGNFRVSLSGLLGDGAALSSGLMVALYLIFLERVRSHASTGFLMFWTGIFSTIFLGIVAYILGESFWPLTLKDFMSVFGQSVLVHVLGQGLIADSLEKVPASYAGIIMFLAPVTAAVLGWLIYEENLTAGALLGMVLVMLSILLVKKEN